MGKHTNAYLKYLKSDAWKAKRRLKFQEQRDNAPPKSMCPFCQECGASGVKVEVHHLTYIRLGRELLEDLVLLCKPCHKTADLFRREVGRKKKQDKKQLAATPVVLVPREQKQRRKQVRARSKNPSPVDGENEKLKELYARRKGEVYVPVVTIRVAKPPPRPRKNRNNSRKCLVCSQTFNGSSFPRGGGWYCSPECKDVKNAAQIKRTSVARKKRVQKITTFVDPVVLRNEGSAAALAKARQQQPEINS